LSVISACCLLAIKRTLTKFPVVVEKIFMLPGTK